ncbi:TetR/AcrR family transcriptional regulator [Ornithinimicrobium cryptoxanthini]|uniref:TetR/AcrR family transcriptional regulator n=1 Tax=Ornithinimicrobium cryptoxanthini TaxID=2934161 RepID=A0ABY4YF95_9MICO|nr:TetR/AcrR family transcriptional regulator [Ornithinimicrobium cryptoxanthini]USQ75445.1 TetR/AcrR family transcriptional regulator [Ornithinimicrobium cryptoxanthini]
MRYHHGDLRRAMLDAAAEAIDRDGVDRLSIRGLARATEVSHTAFRHHFGDRQGLLTALAAQGYAGMSSTLRAVEVAGSEGFLEVGVAYIEWALEHPAHFQVMFRPDLADHDDPTLREALDDLAGALMLGAADFAGREQPGDPRTNPLALAAWSLTHGFVTLALAGNLPTGDTRAERVEMIRSVLRHLAVP